MNILIFDHNQHLIQFKANIGWASEFLLNSQLYSSNPKEVQNYIEEVLKTPMVFSHMSRAYTKPNIYDLRDKEEVDNIPSENLILGQTHYTPEEENWGMLMVDCVRKKVVSMCDLDDEPINEFFSFDLQCFHRRAPHHKNKRPAFFANLQEQYDFVSRLNNLFEHQYWATQDYENGKVLIESKPNEQIGKIHALLKADLEKGTFEDEYISFEKPLYLVLNPATTGWEFHQSLNITDTPIYHKFIHTMLEAGLVLNQEQEKIWLESYAIYESAEYRPLDLSFLESHRQKIMLNENLKEDNKISSTQKYKI